MTGEPGRPVTGEPAQPIVDEPAQPMSGEPAQPIVDEQGRPVTGEPAQPMSGDLPHLSTVLILGGGTGRRLGGRPKAFLELRGETILARMVRLGRGAGERIVAAVPEADVGRAEHIVEGAAQVVAGGASRPETLRRLLAAAEGAARVLILDVSHPLASPELCRRVLDAAGVRGAAVAALPLRDMPVGEDGAPLAERGAAHVLHKPIAAPYEALVAASLSSSGGEGDEAAGALEAMRLAGVPIELVESEPWNVRLTTPDDWRLIQALAEHFG